MKQNITEWANCWLSSLMRYRREAITFFLAGVLEAGSLVIAKAGQSGVRGTSTDPRNGIKRLNRLFKNKHLTQDVTDEILLRHFKHIIRFRKSIILALDWTEKKGIMLLSISLVTDEGRTIPVLWDGYKKRELDETESQNKIEERLVAKVLRAVSRKTQVTIIADRGFDRANFLAFIESFGRNMKYIIRASSDAYAYWRGRELKLGIALATLGKCKNYGIVEYTKEHRLRTRLIIKWEEGMKDPWMLLTNIRNVQSETIVQCYARRMTIEEMFKTIKNETVGLNLKSVRLRDISRWKVFVFAVTLLLNYLWAIALSMPVEVMNRFHDSYTLARHKAKYGKRRKSFSALYLIILLLRDARLSVSVCDKKLCVIPNEI